MVLGEYFPAPRWLGDTNKRGHGIQRTTTLLATSTPTKRNTVRILFYGQSITEQNWWQAVADDLRRRFPHANLIIENRALGGHSSQLLVKTAEADLYPFYPDLLIFHVFGSHLDYCLKVFQRPLPGHFPVRWKAVFRGADEFVSPGVTDLAIETTFTLAHGLENTRHVLEIAGDETTPIAAVRVYRPPLGP
jgi:hypothetical protein